jgi:hypothetical protein
MRQRGDIHLKSEARDSPEGVAVLADFFCNLLGCSNEEGSVTTDEGIKMMTGHWRPSAFLADFREGVSVAREKILRGLFMGFGNIAERMDPDFKGLWRVASFSTGLAVRSTRGRKRRVSPPMMAIISGRPSTPARMADSGDPPTPSQIGSGF